MTTPCSGGPSQYDARSSTATPAASARSSTGATGAAARAATCSPAADGTGSSHSPSGPALAAQTAGPASLVAWVAMIALPVPFAALGARHPDSGGVSTYARRAFGPRAAAVVGWCFFLAVVPGAPAAAMFAGGCVTAASGVRPLTAVVAVLLTVGTMNTYFAGGAKLGAALGCDGAFPDWFARGSRAGEVPRRSLAAIAVLSFLALGIVAAAGVGPKPVVLLTTGSFGLVYVLGTAAALRLLPRGRWARRGAALALACTVALLVTTGPYVLWTVAVAAVALGHEARHRRRTVPRRVGAAGVPAVEQVVTRGPRPSGAECGA